jgi:uncharacterized protein (TIGR03083 family)
MTPERYLAAIATDAERLITAARQDLDAPVSSCPGWLVSDVVEHLAVVYLHKIACTELLQAPDPWPPEPPHDDPIAWLGSARDELLTELESRGPDAPSYTWFPPDQTVGFWYRRMAHETAIHRVDVEHAVGTRTPVEPDLALDGIDEVLTLMLAGDWSHDPQPGPERSLALYAGERSWSVQLGPDRVTVAAPAADPDAIRISAEPSELLLWLWGRGTKSDIRTNDPEAAQALRDRIALATQ